MNFSVFTQFGVASFRRHLFLLGVLLLTLVSSGPHSFADRRDAAVRNLGRVISLSATIGTAGSSPSVASFPPLYFGQMLFALPIPLHRLP